MSNRFVQYIIFLFLFVIPAFSGITLFAADITEVDSTKIFIRQPDAKFVDSYHIQKEYNYNQPPLETNFLKQLINYLKGRFNSWGKISAIIPWIFKFTMVVLVIFFLFIVITKTQLYTIFYSDKEVKMPDITFSNTSDAEIDFDEAIRLQIEQNQYRLAIRLLYLKMINQLRLNGYIRFSKEKTNVDYWHDLTNDDLKSGFYTITSIYNYVWYGDTEIEESQFLRFEKSFQSFYTAIDVQK